MYPLIGITCSYDEDTQKFTISKDYKRAIQAAGGMPLFIPHYDDENTGALLSRIDGVLLAGGGDIDPYYYGEEPLPSNGYIDPLRDNFEILLAGWLWSGMCRF